MLTLAPVAFVLGVIFGGQTYYNFLVGLSTFG